MSLVNMLLVLASAICGIALVEAGWCLFRPAEPRHIAEEAYDSRYMLFGGGGGSAFRNVGEFFLYRPNSVIHSATYYDTKKGWVKEYEYRFNTNNFGLVQKANIEAGKPSVLILGDSFTEGQGAEPWFDKLTPYFLEKNYQAINGGLLGIGSAQWILLHDYLKSRNIVIAKLIVVFLSGNFERAVWNFPRPVLDCLSDYLKCAGDEEFYGLPPDSQRQAFLEKLRQYRIGFLNYKMTLRKLLPATASAYRQARRLAARAGEWLGARHHSPETSSREESARQIRHLSDSYGKDIIFVHIPTREELRDGPDEAGTATRAAIRGTGAKLFDGFGRCGLTHSDYHVNDGHPNAAGYNKIASCVREAAMEIM